MLIVSAVFATILKVAGLGRDPQGNLENHRLVGGSSVPSANSTVPALQNPCLYRDGLLCLGLLSLEEAATVNSLRWHGSQEKLL
jgi:hypothetical protein